MVNTNIKRVIRSNGWTLDRVAAQMGITQPTLSAAINGNPTLDTLQRIADVVGVSVPVLLSGGAEATPGAITCPHCGKSILIKTCVDNDGKE